MRTFLIRWEPIKKYNKDKRNSLVKVTKSTGDIGIDSKAALNIFIATYGNLKKNNVLCIQELDEKGLPIGEPITPMAETSIMPSAVKVV